MTGITHLEHFLNGSGLFKLLRDTIVWDERMAARKTASFGKAYNYSQMSYPYQGFLPELEVVRASLDPVIGFAPNNCLVNYYTSGSSKMGYHSDQTDILEPGTGVAIVSLGATRTLKFRSIADPEAFMSFDLVDGSLIYMTQEVQDNWQHAILKSDNDGGRISLTFRQIK
jgi:alkylated DNA repair dioxygenase AlkB